MNLEVETYSAAIPSGSGDVEAYVASPKRVRHAPCILVIHEIYGIRGHVDQVCADLARSGYVAVAPLFFARHGDVHALTEFSEIHALSLKVPDHEVTADLDATFDWLTKSEKIDPDRIGVTGFCWGGRQVWLYAAHNPRIRASVAWYGGPLVAATGELRPRHPIDVVENLEPPVLGLYGGADEIISRSSIEVMQAALQAAKKPSRILLFPDTPHGFHASNRPNFRPEPAAEGDRQMMAWFSRHMASVLQRGIPS
jgi:carboxymethylenebutenolidase